MEWGQWLGIMAMGIAGFAFIYRELKGFESLIRDEIKSERARTDKLYEMFIGLLQEKKQ